MGASKVRVLSDGRPKANSIRCIGTLVKSERPSVMGIVVRQGSADFRVAQETATGEEQQKDCSGSCAAAGESTRATQTGLRASSFLKMP
jgi:hypothetical protein